MKPEDHDIPGAPHKAMLPLAFSGGERFPGNSAYLDDPAIRDLLAFFERKGLAAIKDEDRLESFYDDWIAFQREHGLYASLLTPAQFSPSGGRFDLLRYARFLEVFAYCSPAHGYSLQVTFLGFFSILMGTNTALKQEAVATLQAGEVLGFGVSEKHHGSDLMAGEFRIAKDNLEGFVANGAKYYIGNADVAAIISTLAKGESAGAHAARAPFVLIALRPKQNAGFRSFGKIHTLGVRAANVGAFEVKDYRLPDRDIIAQGRGAWDAVFGTVTLGKFFLGFGSIGICEHAYAEATAHLRSRILYGKPVMEMPHIQAAVAQAHARLTAMKLFAYRALDYVQTASEDDRRYLLYCAVQKAKVSTEGVRVMALLSECIGGRGFESDTYFEMALRDAPLIPALEGSRHINLGLIAQFIPHYFSDRAPAPEQPPSLVAGEVESRENSYLMEARAGGVRRVAFGPFLGAYRSLARVPNVALFARQAVAFRHGASGMRFHQQGAAPDLQQSLMLGDCLATIVYGQLVAEAAVRLTMPQALVAAIFGQLVEELSKQAITLATLANHEEERRAIMRMIKLPR